MDSTIFSAAFALCAALGGLLIWLQLSNPREEMWGMHGLLPTDNLTL